ncbi:hypothetical protein FHS19_006277 [Paenibacillus rhizosphaerae]|uniref:Uncharacterized protein n=1 Tax=Paenibacillus rhizosphaerae TaxID=297318 RepID=A0A839TWI6_9BACL|nr:hypothetical protein [Paenibacillus rhizosphaerae]MBB3131554.1 hypothetical protein [Paenibacillus rhizosphaerae]
MKLSDKQMEALSMAQKHGGQLQRWKHGGYWTYEREPDDSRNLSKPGWYCTTNTVFALVRRGLVKMDHWESCTLTPEPKRVLFAGMVWEEKSGKKSG